jgi:hypothetical protein
LAILYNDNSCLENHHLSLTFNILQQQVYNIFSLWSDEEKRNARTVITGAVLNTDMAVHKNLNLELLSRSEQHPAYDLSQLDARRELTKIILHTADIFNSARPSEVSAAISRQVCEEFLLQTVKEREAGLTVTPWMVMDSEHAICKGERDFTKYLSRPYFVALAAAFPDIEAMNFVPQIDRNLAFWEKRLANLTQGTQSCD